MISIKIEGSPCRKRKNRGYKEGPKEWQNAIIEQTRNLKPVNYPCILEVVFILPKDRYPTDYPYGPDLDNLLKPLLDALQKTFLKDDSLIVTLNASKKIEYQEKAGVIIKIKPFILAPCSKSAKLPVKPS